MGFVALLVLTISVSFVLTKYVQLEGSVYGDIVAVETMCSKDKQYPVNVTVMTDTEVSVTFHCKDLYSMEVLQDIDLVHYKAQVHYTGDSTKMCVFSQKPNSEYYQIALDISYLQGGVLLYKDAYLVTCTYTTHGDTDRTAPSDIGPPIIAGYELYKHVHRIYNHTLNSSAMFNIDIMDIREDIVKGDVPLGEKIKLRVTMSAGDFDELGMHVFNCVAIGDTPKLIHMPFTLIREGCGEGVVISRSEGFVTKGLTAESPYFRAFQIHGTSKITFVCHFYLCHEMCDGPSCLHSLLFRKKRSTDFMTTFSSPRNVVSHSIKRIKRTRTTRTSKMIKHNDMVNGEQHKHEENSTISENVFNTVKINQVENGALTNDFVNHSTFKSDKAAKKDNVANAGTVKLTFESVLINPNKHGKTDKPVVSAPKSEMEPRAKVLTFVLISAASVCLVVMFVVVTLYKRTKPTTVKHERLILVEE